MLVKSQQSAYVSVTTNKCKDSVVSVAKVFLVELCVYSHVFLVIGFGS